VRYPATITREGKATLAELPDCPGCQTFAEPGESIHAQAGEALTGWLESELAEGRTPPRPGRRLPKNGIWVEVPPLLAVRLTLRMAREDAGLSQAQLARRAGVSQPAIAQLEHPDSNPTIQTLEKVARALGATLRVSLDLEAPSAR
jgi:DNA-binding XRE family transcriptional regulator/predicted RNase H-like HicB family nuclease